MDIVKETKSRARQAQAGFVADLGLGSPWVFPSLWLVARFIWEAIRFWDPQYGYAPPNGLEEARKAVANYKRRRHGIRLDPEKNITITSGSREAIMYLVRIIVEEMRNRIEDKRDEVVLTSPTYPGHLRAVQKAGARVVLINMRTAWQFVRLLERRLQEGLRPAVVVICSVGNPVGFKCRGEDLARLVKLAKQYGFVLIVDEAYDELAYDGICPPSVFRFEGAMEVAIAVMSASKILGVAALKFGAAMGPEKWIAALTEINDNSEGGNGIAQMAVATGLNHLESSVRRLRKLYHHRARLTVRLLQAAGLTAAEMGEGGMFLWIPIRWNDVSFTLLLADLGVVVRPGSMFLVERKGDTEYYIRWCLRVGDKTTKLACERVAQAVRIMRQEERAA